jgi:hypothetical protein
MFKRFSKFKLIPRWITDIRLANKKSSRHQMLLQNLINYYGWTGRVRFVNQKIESKQKHIVQKLKPVKKSVKKNS